jgi:predicted Zn-dependent protease
VLIFVFAIASCARSQRSTNIETDRTLENSTRKYDLSQIGHRHIDQGMNFYSAKSEKKLGEKLSAQFESQTQLLDDVRVTAYVNQIERKIAAHSDAIGLITVRIPEDPEPNAYSLPGGFIYLNTGLILIAENEAQLAAVLAHETGHIAARHFTKLYSQMRLWKWSALIGIGPAGMLFQRTALPLLVMRSSRNAELEADVLGMEYQYVSGYDPSEFPRLLRILTDDAGAPPSFWDRMMDSHPPAKLRLRRVESIARCLPSRQDHGFDNSDFLGIKNRVGDLTGIHLPSSRSTTQK